MEGQKIQATIILDKLLKSKAKIKVLEGGARSSKTWSIIQEIILIFQANKKLSLTVTRENLTWLKDTVLVDFEEILEKYKIPIHPKINKRRPDQTYSILGNEIAFIGSEEEGKLFGRKQDYFWINEALYKVKEKVLDNLEMRTSIGGFVDFNPSSTEHWIYNLEKRNDVDFIHSVVFDNPFAPEAVVKKIISYEPTEENIRNGTANEYNWLVYGLGQRADIKGLVFEYWFEYESVENVEWTVYGLDFGFSKPAALIKVSKKGNELYFEEMLYEVKKTNADLNDRFLTLGLNKQTDEIIADSENPLSIEELKRMGWKIKEAIKGPGSVIFGIQLMQQYKLFAKRGSKNLQREFKNYKFADNKEGKPNKSENPIKEFDHTMDAVRYVCMAKLGKKKKKLVIA